VKSRLDKELVKRGLVVTRSQAESYIRLGQVSVNDQVISKAGFMVAPSDKLKLLAQEQYVSRAGLKLASVADVFRLNFKGKAVLDVGSSTGGFTDYALQHGAERVIAVEVGSNQLHPSLRTNLNIELHEQTDIRDYAKTSKQSVDIVVIDVSFISLREILPSIVGLISPDSQIVAMVKPQFEATGRELKHKGVIKNEALRRTILKDFELWAKQYFKVTNKADSRVTGEKGNKERFYLLSKLR
jgi:23S rRNA (cytidine1920-2'-O)/16S rRNA (cytidine1409-2'-O)-methyltransferase